MKIIGVIPARYSSTRFPGKPLALIKGKSLIERVWRQVKKSKQLDAVVIATDDERISAVAAGFGAEVIMTSQNCSSGTDRLAEVAITYGKSAAVFINIQGDEPLISPSLIDSLVLAFKNNSHIDSVTAAYPFKNLDEINNPNSVKVVLDCDNHALYFSRCPIPYNRSDLHFRYLKHIGIYGYKRDFLLKFSSWDQTPLEKIEQLEQLRILEKGHKMKVVISRNDSHGVDVPSDIKKIERLIK